MAYNKNVKIIYTTLNNNEQAKKIGRALLEKQLANCVNFFPITCIYNYENEITEKYLFIKLQCNRSCYYNLCKNLLL